MVGFVRTAHQQVMEIKMEKFVMPDFICSVLYTMEEPFHHRDRKCFRAITYTREEEAGGVSLPTHRWKAQLEFCVDGEYITPERYLMPFESEEFRANLVDYGDPGEPVKPSFSSKLAGLVSLALDRFIDEAEGRVWQA